jgi:single-stranded-DNA-specific exonuclease
MPDPNVLTAMPEAAARVADAVVRGERVAIFGDYDVDGATSAALLARFLRHAGIDPMIHIPDRLFEGYGPNIEAVRALAGRGATLLVAVGAATSVEPLAGQGARRRRGRDHHQADEVLPPAVAIVNQIGATISLSLGHLAAVGHHLNVVA